MPEYTVIRIAYTFATLSVSFQEVARKGMQYGTMYLIPYLKHYRNELP